MSDALFAVRNHPSVRAGMRDSRPLSIEGHRAWVSENLLVERKLDLFLVEQRNTTVGLTLLRNFRGDSAEVGVMLIMAEQRPLACYRAAHLIAYQGFEVLGLERLFSYVPQHNARALAFNLHCGFLETGKLLNECRELVLGKAHSRFDRTHHWFRGRHPIKVMP